MDKEKQREQLSINAIINSSRNVYNTYKKYGNGDDRPLCKCGCGKLVSKRKYRKKHPAVWNEYIIGHFNRTKHKYLESRDETNNPPLCLCGCNQEVKRNKRNKYKWNKFVKGHGTKGKTWEESIGEEKAKLLKEQLSERSKGEKNNMKRPEHRKRQSDMVKSWGDKHPMRRPEIVAKFIDWEFYNKHGYQKHFEPYDSTFNKELKHQIAERDVYSCQLCGEMLPDKFAIHHIDYNKKNSNENNLIFLCGHCHSKTNSNSNHKFWQSHFELYQKERGYI